MNLVAAEGGDAEEVARQRGRSRVVEADIFRKIEALRTLATLADQVCHGGLAHSHAVAQRATRIAVAMDLDRQAVLAVQLAGELHEIGSLFVGPATMTTGRTRSGCCSASRLIRMAGLQAAGDAVAAMHERIDGSGVPGHQRGDEIPIGARILAVANAFETVVDGLGRGDRGLDAAIRHLRDQSGKAFDREDRAIALAQATTERPSSRHRAGARPAGPSTSTRQGSTDATQRARRQRQRRIRLDDEQRQRPDHAARDRRRDPGAQAPAETLEAMHRRWLQHGPGAGGRPAVTEPAAALRRRRSPT